MLNKEQLNAKMKSDKERKERNDKDWAPLVSKYWIWKINKEIRDQAKRGYHWADYEVDSDNIDAMALIELYYQQLGYTVRYGTNCFGNQTIYLRWDSK